MFSDNNLYINILFQWCWSNYTYKIAFANKVGDFNVNRHYSAGNMLATFFRSDLKKMIFYFIFYKEIL